MPSTSPCPTSARAMGFADTGALWRSQYDMAPDAFAAEMERLWQQIKPLYDVLHTYTRDKLRQHYGAHLVPALPATFWERSLLTKPKDRDVVCHASAWDLDTQLDARIKMCITPTGEDFTTIHHELGHLYYGLAWRKQSPLFKNGANDGFHEAIGDTVALSITPAYLQQVGLMTQASDPAQDIAPLLHRALEKVAFMPFAFLVD